MSDTDKNKQIARENSSRMFAASALLTGAFMVGVIGNLGDHYYNKAPVRSHHLKETFISKAHYPPVQVNPPFSNFNPAKDVSRYLASLYLLVGAGAAGWASRKKVLVSNSEEQLSLYPDNTDALNIAYEPVTPERA